MEVHVTNRARLRDRFFVLAGGGGATRLVFCDFDQRHCDQSNCQGAIPWHEIVFARA